MRAAASIPFLVALSAAVSAGSVGPVPIPTYGADGMTLVDFALGGTHADYAHAAVMQGNRLLLAGSAGVTGDSTYPTKNRPALARLMPDGTPDPGFGTNGRIAFLNAPGTDAIFSDVMIDAQGRILVMGAYRAQSNTDYTAVMFMRLSADGLPDTAFGPNGYRLLTFGPSNTPVRMAIQADGRLVAAVNAGGCIAVVRLNTNGTTDTSFRAGGSECLTSDNPTTPIAFAGDVRIQPDGHIVVVGLANHSAANNGEIVAFRLLPNGSLDQAFGTAGATYIGYDQGGTLYEEARAVAIDSQNRLVLAGAFNNLDSTDVAIVRLLPNGQPDPAFGASGKSSISFGSNTLATASGVTILSDDRILLGGQISSVGESLGFAAVVGPNGALDTRFGDAGTWLRAAPGTDNGLNFTDLVVDGDSLYLTGHADTTTVTHDADMAATRMILPIFSDGFE